MGDATVLLPGVDTVGVTEKFNAGVATAALTWLAFELEADAEVAAARGAVYVVVLRPDGKLLFTRGSVMYDYPCKSWLSAELS